MKNKRGQVFALALFLITLFMCGVVVALYWVEQGNADSSLVSPRGVFEMRDELEIFEIRERALAEYLSESIDGEFGGGDFILEFREGFLDGVIGNEKMSEFVFDGLVFNDRDFEDDARELGREFLDVNLYSGVSYKNGKLVFGRNKMGKRVLLEASDSGKNNFPVGFVYEFAKEYTVSENKEVVE